MNITETWAEFRYRARRGTLIPYPLRAAKFSLDFQPFGFWLLPSFVKRDLTELARAQGETIWWARWAWFQISYSRWV